MKISYARSLAFGAFLALGFLALASPGVNALGQPMSSLEAKVTSVTTTAELVTGDMDSGNISGWKSCTVWNNSATPLHIGSKDVDATDGFPICTDTASCPAATITVDARVAYYISSSGTLTPNVLCGK